MLKMDDEGTKRPSPGIRTRRTGWRRYRVLQAAVQNVSPNSDLASVASWSAAARIAENGEEAGAGAGHGGGGDERVLEQPFFERGEDDVFGEDRALEVVEDFDAVVELRCGPV